MKSVYCAVRTGSLNKTVCATSLKNLSNILQCKLQDKFLGRSYFAIFNIKQDKITAMTVNNCLFHS